MTKQNFEVQYSLQKYTKTQILGKKELVVSDSSFLRYLEYFIVKAPQCRPFWYDTQENLRKTRDANKVRNFSVFD